MKQRTANFTAAKVFLKALSKGAYAWPGGYPIYFLTSDGAVLSFKAAQEEKRQIVSAILNRDTRGGWHVEGADINWEDAQLYCDHTGERIESAYAED